MLIAAKAFVYQAAEGGPINARDLAFDRLQPATGGTGELHCGALHPHGWVDRIEIKVVVGTSHPVLGIVAIKLGEVHFG